MQKIHKNNFNKKIIKQIKHLNEIDKIHLIEKKDQSILFY